MFTFLLRVVISNPFTYKFGVTLWRSIGDPINIIFLSVIVYNSFYVSLILEVRNDHSCILQ